MLPVNCGQRWPLQGHFIANTAYLSECNYPPLWECMVWRLTALCIPQHNARKSWFRRHEQPPWTKEKSPVLLVISGVCLYLELIATRMGEERSEQNCFVMSESNRDLMPYLISISWYRKNFQQTEHLLPTVRLYCCIFFLKSSQNTPHTAPPLKPGMRCILWVQTVVYTLPLWFQWCTLCHVIFDCVITAIHYTYFDNHIRPSKYKTHNIKVCYIHRKTAAQLHILSF